MTDAPLFRITLGSPEWHYMGVRVQSPESRLHLNELDFKHLVTHALSDLHGEFGAAVPVDILQWNPMTGCGILRVPEW
ncbi:Ribonuclease P protein subunit p14 [Tieghemiomyces parasiticus]|uniref:Ribonuclease P protein subunit p14 n=1 Tax=Tieghemiomyces parasiticus TaxID=78921 RepID=A0A9W8AFI5_9FUNG|nr:Ribonuclease P protein subunit p14 [Tieghemiomyces parasiticus]